MGIDLKQVEEFAIKMRQNPKKTILIIVVLIIVGVMWSYADGFFGEKGKQNASAAKSADGIKSDDKIYQGKNAVGNVTGYIKIDGDKIFFPEITDTSNLKRNTPFEYQGVKYLIVSIETSSTLMLQPNRDPRHSVLSNVVGKKYK